MSIQEKRNRIKRNERQPNPTPIRLTERDIEIVRAIFDYRVLTTDHLKALFFPSYHQAYNRLAALYHHGFLDRRFLGAYIDMNNSPIVYVLDERGADLIRRNPREGIEKDFMLEWRSESKQVGIQFLEHSLAINTVRVAVAKACQQSDDFAILRWLSESDLKDNYDYVTIRTETGRPQRISIIPDGYFVLQTPLGTAHFFLEQDRGTMSNRRFKNKILAYQMYYQSGMYEKRYNTKSLRVLTVASSPNRVNNLVRVTQEADGKQRYWFTTLANATPENILRQPIWQVATNPGTHILIE